jgi:trigger factor
MSQIQIQTLDGLARKVSFVLPLDSVATEEKNLLAKTARNFRKDGFRVGKVPLHIIQKERGEDILFDVQVNKIKDLFFSVSKDNNLNIVGQPTIEQQESAPEGHFAFDVLFEVYPKFDAPNLAGVALTKYTCEIDKEEQVTKAIDLLRTHYATYEEADSDAAVKNDDQVTIDFQGKLDGVVFDGGSATGYQFIVGKRQMLEDFEAGVLGMKVGEHKNITVNFPENYSAKNLAGKTTEFMLSLHKIEHSVLPEVNAAFAMQVSEKPDVDALKQDIHDSLVRETKKRTFNMLKKQIFDILAANTVIDIPKAMLEEECASLFDSFRRNLEERGFKDANNLPFKPEMFMDEAKKRSHLSLILSQIAKEHNIVAQPEKVKAEIEDLAKNYEQASEIMKWYYEDQDRLNSIKSYVIESNIIELLCAQANVTEQVISFDELTQKEKQAEEDMKKEIELSELSEENENNNNV